MSQTIKQNRIDETTHTIKLTERQYQRIQELKTCTPDTDELTDEIIVNLLLDTFNAHVHQTYA